MADDPPSKDGPVTTSKPAAATKPAGNPAFRALGLPRISKWKLPSRNWLIFLGVTGSWTAALLYDRYHKKRVQKKWCQFVSHLADETLPNNMMPRKIMILLASPPGDGLRPAREHFHEYIKPVLVAGAVDWEVIEGRREGEVRAGLAEKIRKLRRRRGEKFPDGDEEEEEPDLVWETRQKLGISEWDGVHGELILGRHTWKEYIRGLHEGWLGPLEAPQPPPDLDVPSDGVLSDQKPNLITLDSTQPTAEDSGSQESTSLNSTPTTTEDRDSQDPTTLEEETKKPPDKPPKPSPTPAYIFPQDYSSSPASPTLPSVLSPSLPLQLPHLLGIKHTPTRVYRFLTRRHLADDTGAQVAALVLAARARPYKQSASFASAADPDTSSSVATEGDVVAAGETWEQESLLKDEESGWHKSVRKEQKLTEGEEPKERVWTEKIVIDPRIGGKMRVFELEEGANARAEGHAEEMRKKEPSLLEKGRKYLGWERQGKKGWEMGEEGDEFS